MAINKLNKTFISEQVLQATEMNQISKKIDELVDGVNTNANNIPDVGQLATKTELSSKANKVSVENVSENTKELQPNKYYIFGEMETLTLTLAAGEENKLSEYMFEFTSGTTPTTLTLPESVKWIGGNTIEASKTYQVSIVNNIAVLGGA